MYTTKDVHQTNQRVEEAGKYVCASGETMEFQIGDKFPVCPITKEDTTWRHAEHVHKTGDKVTEKGHYIDNDGEHVDLNQGEIFPDCPKSHQPTTWKHAKN
jgi:hypothetical protein